MTKSVSRSVSLLAFAACLLLAACNTPTDSAAAPKRDRNAPPPGAGKGRWVTTESALGSNLPRRVWVNEDGTFIADPGDRVQAVSGEAVRRVEVGGQRSLKGGN